MMVNEARFESWKHPPTFAPIDKGWSTFQVLRRLSSREALLLLPPCLPTSLFSSAAFYFYQALFLFPAAHPSLSPPAARTRPPRTAAASVCRLSRRAVARLCLPLTLLSGRSSSKRWRRLMVDSVTIQVRTGGQKDISPSSTT
jgi:hypothetical protein